MEQWQCAACDYVFTEDEDDPGSGAASGTSFDDIPESWVCPECGASKDQFEKKYVAQDGN